jgi:peroxiredoxin
VEFACNELLTHYLLSDSDLQLAGELPLPTVTTKDKRVYEPLTFTAKDGHITHVFYPVSPAQEITDVMVWIRNSDAS